MNQELKKTEPVKRTELLSKNEMKKVTGGYEDAERCLTDCINNSGGNSAHCFDACYGHKTM